MRNYIPREVLNSRPSAGRELYIMRVRGEIGESDYCIQSALQTVESLDAWYAIRRFMTISHDSLTYAQGRIRGQMEYDPHSAMRLGEWCKQTLDRYEAIESDVMHLLWCIEKLTPVSGMDTRIEKLRAKIERLQDNGFPREVFTTATQAQALDARAREAEKRGR